MLQERKAPALGFRNWAWSFVHFSIFILVYERPNKGVEKESQKQHTLADSAEAAPGTQLHKQENKTTGCLWKTLQNQGKELDSKVIGREEL